jgi:hypothetical protein
VPSLFFPEAPHSNTSGIFKAQKGWGEGEASKKYEEEITTIYIDLSLEEQARPQNESLDEKLR